MQNDDVHVQSVAPATKTATHLLKTSQKYCACHAERLWTCYKKRLNVTKCHTCAARNEATRSLKPPKAIPSAELTIGMWPSRGRLRTIVDGWEFVSATSSEHTLSPQTPGVKREPLLRIRERIKCRGPRTKCQ